MSPSPLPSTLGGKDKEEEEDDKDDATGAVGIEGGIEGGIGDRVNTVCCDWCQSSFHLVCVGLKKRPPKGFFKCQFCISNDSEYNGMRRRGEGRKRSTEDEEEEEGSESEDDEEDVE